MLHDFVDSFIQENDLTALKYKNLLEGLDDCNLSIFFVIIAHMGNIIVLVFTRGTHTSSSFLVYPFLMFLAELMFLHYQSLDAIYILFMIIQEGNLCTFQKEI